MTCSQIARYLLSAAIGGILTACAIKAFLPDPSRPQTLSWSTGEPVGADVDIGPTEFGEPEAVGRLPAGTLFEDAGLVYMRLEPTTFHADEHSHTLFGVREQPTKAADGEPVWAVRLDGGVLLKMAADMVVRPESEYWVWHSPYHAEVKSESGESLGHVGAHDLGQLKAKLRAILLGNSGTKCLVRVWDRASGKHISLSGAEINQSNPWIPTDVRVHVGSANL